MQAIAETNATQAKVLCDTPPQQPKLLDRVRDRIRVKHLAYRTEQTYIHWIKRFIYFHNKRHPQEMSAPEVEVFLSHLATARDVSASTQNQAMHAILFLYRAVLEIKLPWLDGITRAKTAKRLPVVLDQQETADLLSHTKGTPGLVVKLLYGTGLRLMEALRLRVKDIDFTRRTITVRGGKGDKVEPTK